MNRVDPHFAYFSILSVIQPASIEEIEECVASVFGSEHVNSLVSSGRLRWAHDDALKNKAVIKMSDNEYFIARWAMGFVRLQGLDKSIDNRRLFMLKSLRKRRIRSK